MLKICLSKNIQKGKFYDLTHAWERGVGRGMKMKKFSKVVTYRLLKSQMRRSNCSTPIPLPGQPRGHHFFGGCPGLLIALFFPCPTLYKHSSHSFFQCPALIYHTHFSSDPRAAPGGWGQNSLTGA